MIPSRSARLYCPAWPSPGSSFGSVFTATTCNTHQSYHSPPCGDPGTLSGDPISIPGLTSTWGSFFTRMILSWVRWLGPPLPYICPTCNTDIGTCTEAVFFAWKVANPQNPLPTDSVHCSPAGRRCRGCGGWAGSRSAPRTAAPPTPPRPPGTACRTPLDSVHSVDSVDSVDSVNGVDIVDIA